MPTIDIGIPVINQKDLTLNCTSKLMQNAGAYSDYNLFIIDNGSDIPYWPVDVMSYNRVKIIRNDQNIGLPKALNQVLEASSADYVMLIHNDVMIHEQGWDTKIIRILDQNPNIGVAGFYGAKGIGSYDIYQAPYQKIQMARWGNVSGCHRMDAAIHGFRPPVGEIEDIAVLDGFCLIVKRDLFRFDENYTPHHMYDNDICLQSLKAGCRNIVISMDAEHLGGRTDVNEDWNKPFGIDKQEVHDRSHVYFYEKWRGFLPKGVA